MFNEFQQPILDFDSIRLKVASPEVIHAWSHGEVVKPETINYRTQKPEKDGLFCERIFGPTKDWECYCGKYKRIRYKGIICDKCGVEVTRSIVRRERMGHIDLVVPVSHIWFLRGIPSKLGLVLDISPQALERVIYFADYIILNVNEELKRQTIEQIQDEYKSRKKQIENDFNNRIKQSKGSDPAKTEAIINQFNQTKKEALGELSEALDKAKKELSELKALKIISESNYQDLSLKYGHVFEAGIGAEAVHKILQNLELAVIAAQVEAEMKKAAGGVKKKLAKRLKLFNALKKNQIKPEWMIITTLPVIPPDLRPMVQLDGGRFAASDLNDLYRRVINRNNRLKKLIELEAPEVICRNEKRMLQEAVDALIDNSARHGKTVTASTGQKRMLKSLADILKGKQGRFRQNLLGKRVDYSGRSVIVVGPYLKIDECGLPKRMALELFKPFIIAELIKKEYAHNVRSANRFIESDRDEVWDILEKITKDAHVLLNRAPTLHRLGIQAFKPLLIEGKAIQLHPLVCPPFNADFDGDQMAVHVPLTEEAKQEAKEIILSSKNILKPATGDPSITPAQDFVLGCYLLTTIKERADGKLKTFSNETEARQAYEAKVIGLQDKIKVRFKKEGLVETNVGRLIFNKIVPAGLGFVNKQMDKGGLKNLVRDVLETYGTEKAVEFLDNIKNLSIKYVTLSGISWGMDDLPSLPEKHDIFKAAAKEVEEVENQYNLGFLTNDERHIKVVEIWVNVKDKIVDLCKEKLNKAGPVFAMMNSGARGSWGQTTQMMGMRGLMANPSGETIELPVKASLKEGMQVLEYFITTHGARKGLSDTALRTANAGYLTRRLIDVAQDVIIFEEDCGDDEGIIIYKKESQEMNETIVKRIKGRVLLSGVKDKKGKVVAKAGDVVDEKIAQKIEEIDPAEVKIRSVLTCKSARGVCAKCYGWDLGYNKIVKNGVAAGIIAAQSIGEPGTQLTMRTFHTGGVAGGGDITQGLPRVEEIFEARTVKKPAFIAPVSGTAEIINNEVTREKTIKIAGTEVQEEIFYIQGKDIEKIVVKNNAKVKKGDLLVESQKKLRAPLEGRIAIHEESDGRHILKVIKEEEVIKEMAIARGVKLLVADGDRVEKGDPLTSGPLDLAELYKLKGQRAVEKYVIKEIQYVYSSQGQPLNDKHIEVIVRKMFSKVLIEDPGDTLFSPGEILEKIVLAEENEKMVKEKKQKALASTILLGITKSSLATQSFLSAASFQETTRVLIDAAVTGKIDHLRGLKENVIIGKLIPCGTGYDKEAYLGKPKAIVTPKSEE
ncbi:DNA-directed RNA polymerase subunit beta' [Candidatus Kuenenbacteria bacterium RIFCSPLOWO2_12_FULL_42_13]|uniref:DNA-directed RNA polymerase subunit beta' n=4 Tax=Candidatus Kueneniibacteriota TaxID=1752740 RepID=A0A0G0Z434_9BACT|nr:MAG: DNA-directed RNA polymerase subunit beta' [Candidatus Kuenenbacteria bacterium GW2011_GWA2_42_15]OGG89833.1 MAG: DNA-directed RNA polymerase subunit beta' [Candidatus Kuenenbacteria bacterium RIFCSPHIGHO2_02_FULL_42_29]OGG91732.1 MAG: DNA-directed RNA polymerase subunit beta' [Candidatus Kuenenbacteria bacterium RIFCSPLOWO2_02_FULL_42_16]OGG92179.1 MAG: DNA-directed RNA polymerase subunit beta' [Candidatus Kuenenbacteria bacterium RIFCSPLOWO2_12_FULL_42_13]OGH00987.1 MAG: DNA-directed R